MNEQQRASSSWDPFPTDSLMLYNIPLIKFKVTLEILTPELKKTQTFTPQLVSE